MAERKFTDEDYSGLIRLMESGVVGSPNWEVGKTKLTLANMEVQADASKNLVVATDQLVNATRMLGWYTLALVLATVVLVIVTSLTLSRTSGGS